MDKWCVKDSNTAYTLAKLFTMYKDIDHQKLLHILSRSDKDVNIGSFQKDAEIYNNLTIDDFVTKGVWTGLSKEIHIPSHHSSLKHLINYDHQILNQCQITLPHTAIYIWFEIICQCNINKVSLVSNGDVVAIVQPNKKIYKFEPIIGGVPTPLALYTELILKIETTGPVLNNVLVSTYAIIPPNLTTDEPFTLNTCGEGRQYTCNNHSCIGS